MTQQAITHKVNVPIDSSWVDATKLSQIAEITGMKLECACCLMLLNNDPHDLGCGHAICSSCITFMVQSKTPSLVPQLICSKHSSFCCRTCSAVTGLEVKCPMCRKIAKSTHAIIENATVLRAVGMLEMTCPCGNFAKKSINDYVRKHYFECPDVAVTCPDCVDAVRLNPSVVAEAIKRRDMPVHQSICAYRKGKCELCKEIVLVQGHPSKCPNIPIACVQECGLQIERRLMAVHLEYACPKNQIVCPFCKMTIPCSELWRHFVICSLHPIMCPTCHVVVTQEDMLRHSCKIDSKPSQSIKRRSSSSSAASRKAALLKIRSEMEAAGVELEVKEDKDGEDWEDSFRDLQLEDKRPAAPLRQSRLPFTSSSSEQKQSSPAPPTQIPVRRYMGPGGGGDRKTPTAAFSSSSNGPAWVPLQTNIGVSSTRPRACNVDIMLMEPGSTQARKAKIVQTKGDLVNVQYTNDAPGSRARVYSEWMSATNGRILVRDGFRLYDS